MICMCCFIVYMFKFGFIYLILVKFLNLIYTENMMEVNYITYSGNTKGQHTPEIYLTTFFP